MYPSKKSKNLRYVLQLLVLVAIPILTVQSASAVYLSSRYVQINNSIAGASALYKIGFTISTAATLGSVQLEFCSNSPLIDDPCTTPLGLDVGGSTLALQAGETGFSIDPSSTPANVLLTRTPSASLAAPVSYSFSGVNNPSAANSTFYVRVYTFPTNNGTGAYTDNGSAAFSTSGSYGTTAFVPPHLDFCVGVTVDPGCASSTGHSVTFGDLKTTQVKSATTQFAAATNDTNGYVVYSLGTTMTSGNDTITAMNIPNPSIAGFSQFGLNLRANNNPGAGQNMSGGGLGAVKPNYNTADLFMYQPGAAVAEATQSTDFNVYTATYIANIPIGQPVGVYATTISYMAVAQF